MKNVSHLRLVDITPFVRGVVLVNRKAEQAEIDAGNKRIDKAQALLSATRILNHLVVRANQNGRPHTLIVKALRTQLGIVRELDVVRGERMNWSAVQCVSDMRTPFDEKDETAHCYGQIELEWKGRPMVVDFDFVGPQILIGDIEYTDLLRDRQEIIQEAVKIFDRCESH